MGGYTEYMARPIFFGIHAILWMQRHLAMIECILLIIEKKCNPREAVTESKERKAV